MYLSLILHCCHFSFFPPEQNTFYKNLSTLYMVPSEFIFKFAMQRFEFNDCMTSLTEAVVFFVKHVI